MLLCLFPLCHWPKKVTPHFLNQTELKSEPVLNALFVRVSRASP